MHISQVRIRPIITRFLFTMFEFLDKLEAWRCCQKKIKRVQNQVLVLSICAVLANRTADFPQILGRQSASLPPYYSSFFQFEILIKLGYVIPTTFYRLICRKRFFLKMVPGLRSFLKSAFGIAMESPKIFRCVALIHIDRSPSGACLTKCLSKLKLGDSETFVIYSVV